jgi:hypothetical protein
MATADAHPDIVCRENETSHRERSCWQAINISIIQQLAFLFASLFIRDGGATLDCALEAMLFSWIPIAIVVCHQATHRSYTPSNVHLAICRHCFWVLFVALIVISGVTH